MGIDLTLCPVRWHELKGGWLLYDRIGLEREHHFFEAIRERTAPRPLCQHELPARYYHDGGLEETETDSYGTPLTCLMPNDFESLESAYPLNQAIIDFMRTLPPDMPIVLWWH